MRDSSLPAWLEADLATWARADLPPYPYRTTHPHVSRARNILAGILEHQQLNRWCDVLPSSVQLFLRSQSTLKPGTLNSYLKSLRRWLRWHERDEQTVPRVSPRLAGLAPRDQQRDPEILTPAQRDRLLDRCEWVFAGSTAIRFTLPSGKQKRACMTDWPRGAFKLFVRLCLKMGFRPWEAALLSWPEVQLDIEQPLIRLIGHELRPLKTPMAGTRLLVPEPLLPALVEYRERCSAPYLFAVRCDRSANGWRPPNYDTIWRALREELELPGLNARTLRRTFATELARRTPNLFDVAAATRHVRVQTLQHYVQLAGGGVIDPKTGRRIELA